MTRQELIDILHDGGVENPSKLMINSIMDQVVAEKKQAVEDAVSTATAEVKESYKDYKTPDEYNALQNEIANLKDADNKASRTAKYKEAGLLDKYIKLAEADLKDAENWDEAFNKWKKDNAELFQTTKQEETQPTPPKQDKVVFTGQTGKSVPQKEMTVVEKLFYEANPDLMPKQ